CHLCRRRAEPGEFSQIGTTARWRGAVTRASTAQVTACAADSTPGALACYSCTPCSAATSSAGRRSSPLRLAPRQATHVRGFESVAVDCASRHVAGGLPVDRAHAPARLWPPRHPAARADVTAVQPQHHDRPVHGRLAAAPAESLHGQRTAAEEARARALA